MEFVRDIQFLVSSISFTCNKAALSFLAFTLENRLGLGWYYRKRKRRRVGRQTSDKLQEFGHRPEPFSSEGNAFAPTNADPRMFVATVQNVLVPLLSFHSGKEDQQSRVPRLHAVNPLFDVAFRIADLDKTGLSLFLHKVNHIQPFFTSAPPLRP
jgi:hypothetical protein